MGQEEEDAENYAKSDSSLNDKIDELKVKNEPKKIENNDDGISENVDFSRPDLLVQVELEDIKGKSENTNLNDDSDEKKVKDYHNNSELFNPDDVDNIKMEPTEDTNLDYSNYSMIYDANNEDFDYYDDVKTELNEDFNDDLDSSIYATADSQDFPIFPRMLCY